MRAQPSFHVALCVCVLEYYPKKHKYKVQFVIPGEEPYIDVIPASYLRGAVPTRMSKLEKGFFDT